MSSNGKPKPRMTIGIPTLNRPHRIHNALNSCLHQAQPVNVIVADQGGSSQLQAVLKEYRKHPSIRYIKTDATCLWANWTAAAEACDTELFAWLQDDDVIAPRWINRVTEAFDRHPECHTYAARLAVTMDSHLACWWLGNGPVVPMDLIHGSFAAVEGGMFAPVSWFCSMGLSPGVAFRFNNDFLSAVRRCPLDCDLYGERIILAETGRYGGVVCDPCLVGYWIRNKESESLRLLAAKERDRQFRVMIRHIDGLIPQIPRWKDFIVAWLSVLSPTHGAEYLRDTKKFAKFSPYLAEARGIIESFMQRGTRLVKADPVMACK